MVSPAGSFGTQAGLSPDVGTSGVDVVNPQVAPGRVPATETLAPGESFVTGVAPGGSLVAPR